MISIMIIIVLFSLFTIALLVNQYFLYRHKKVRRFRLELIEMAYTAAKKAILCGEDDIESLISLCDKYSYDDMLYSFKPLTLEAWYSEEEIKILKGEK